MVIFRLACLALCAALTCFAQSAWAASARLSASEIYLYETVQLELTASEEASPGLSALRQDFDVQGSSSQRSMQIVNGQIQVSEFTLTLTLRPLRAGVLAIPPISLGNEQTNPLHLQVNAIDAATQQEIDRNAFMEVDVSHEAPYQGQAVFLTRRLYYSSDVQIYGNLPGIPSITGASVQPVGEASASSTVVNGRRYNVYVTEYLLVPDLPGELIIPGVEIMARVQVALGNGRRALGTPIRTAETVLNVQPPPANFPAHKPWLPAREVRIDSEFNTVEGQVGTPLTFDVRVQVVDALASQIAPLRLAFPSSIKAYPESPRLDDAITSGEVRGERLERFSLVPTTAGIFTLPEVRVTWWDTQAEQLRESSLPARDIEVLPDPNAPPPANQASVDDSRTTGAPANILAASPATRFDWLHAALALVCLSLGAGWVITLRPGLLHTAERRQRSNHQGTPEAHAFARAKSASHLADMVASLRIWLRHVDSEHPLHADLEAHIKRSEASLYGCLASEAAPTANELQRTARELRAVWLAEQKHRKTPALASLYPA